MKVLVLFNKLNPHVFNNEIIPHCQYGYKAKTGLHNLHIDLQTKLFKYLNDKNYLGVDMVFLDLSDAFNTVSHKKLLVKLDQYGIRGDFHDILTNTFTDRKQSIKFDNEFSDESDIKSGVIQGGVLSPILFNIYIAEIHEIIDSELFQFADDMLVLRAIKSVEDCEILQNDLHSITNFCLSNSLRINASKCSQMRITLKNNELFNYIINDNMIQKVQKQKYVGIIYDEKLSFNDHNDSIINKALKKFSFIKYMSKRLNPKVLKRLYQTYVLPILEYSNLCYSPTQTQNENLESVQRKILRYICYKSGQNNLNYENRLNYLNMFSLDKRRKIQILKTFFKIVYKHKTIDNLWFNEIEFYESKRHGLQSKTMYFRLKTCDKSFFKYSSDTFNSLPVNIRNEKSFSRFVKLLKQHF